MNQTEKLTKVVYTPESQMRTPVRLFQSMFRDLAASRELAWRLFVRDVSAQYRQSMLGLLWTFFPPIVAGLIFIILQSKKVVNFGATDIPYPVFVLVGTTLWQVFSESINAPLQAVAKAKPMLAKINFPREAIFFSAFYQTVFNCLIKSVIIIGILLIFKIQITFGILIAPLAIFVLILLGMSIGMFLAPIGTLYTDIQQGLVMFIQFWFFVTPVVYPPPQTFPYSLIATLNPVSPILMTARDLITKGQFSNIEQFLVISGLTLLAMIVGWMIYRVALPILIERMSA